MERGDYLLKVAPYGYERYERTLIVNEAEAVIVRRIYADYTSGKSTRQIADELNEENVPRKDPTVAWKRTAVEYILSNEKYIGDQMYLKRYRTDTFPFVRVRNHGEHVYYYVEETHQPIVTKTIFEYAQKLRTSRVPKCVTTASEYTPLSGAIHCGECGKVFRIVNRAKSVQWACRTHHKNVAECPTKCVPEAEVIRAFTEMYNKLKANRKIIITPIINQLVTLKNRISAQSVEFAELDRQIMLVNDQLALIADLKQKQMIDEETFRRKSNELNNSMSSLRSKRRLFLNNSQADQAIADMKRLASIIDKGPDKIDGLDEELFDSLVEDIIVDTSDEIKFKLIGGLVLKETIERTKR